MSRLIIKNLPAYLTQERLREHFSAKDGPGGTITDVKVVLKPDGTSRRFGFVGFKTDAEAQKAQKWYDKSFIHSSRISVAVVDGAKDAPPPRPNKRPRLGPSPTEVPNVVTDGAKKSNKSTAKPAADDDTQLEAFMQVMQPRSKKGPSWKDNDATLAAALESSSKDVRTSQASEPPAESSDKVDSDKTDVLNDAAVSDMDWLKQHMKRTLDIKDTAPEKAFKQSDDEDDDMVGQPEAKTHQPSAEEKAKNAILQTGRLFLRNLSFACTEDEISDLFSSFGNIIQVHIPLDPLTKTSKGMAYVSFADPTNAVTAFEALDKKSFQGRLLHILPAVDRKGNAAVELGAGKKTLKGERDTKRKSTAGKDFNWSMLYMNSDAVASSIADRMNLPKSDILNPESDNAAVKLALAETHIIQETKSFLETNGVVLSSFSGPRVARSDTTILVKNIPYGTSADQIRELFEPHGKLERVLVPPAGTMAVVEFAHPDEGRQAFKAVAYRRLGNSVIYLEKGPVGMFIPADGGSSTGGTVTATAVQPVTIADADAEASTEEPAPLAAGSTLFVKNLSFSTTQERLVQAFRHLPDFAFARVQTKPDPKRPALENARLSMGYGFVGFKTSDSARKAMKSLQGFVLDGHALVVKFAGRGAEEQDVKDTGKAKSRTTKMIVKNVPFEATKKDIRELFGSHGQLKSVRLPKKFDHRSRGFAFLEFVTRQEAENAYAMLKHTHLLGRHLVLEWAEEDSNVDVDELRRKAGVGYGGGNELPGKKRKLALGGDGENGGDLVDEL